MANIGVIGMAVMGKNLALNLESRGYEVAIYNRTHSVTEEVLRENEGLNLVGSESIEKFVGLLERPRKIIIMVKAGNPVDMTIESLIPYLDKGDIIIDGGNSFFRDSERRYRSLKDKGLNFVGLGVSGGETGARFGPALMPGCDKEVYQEIKPYLESIAARAEDGLACSAWLGTGGAGHYVKMVHNGIEYADMEQIAETYFLLKNLGGISNLDQADLFDQWNKGELSSYLIEITSNILKEADDTGKSGQLLDYIEDISLQKGTGKWTNLEAVELGVDSSVLAAGLNARVMSMLKDERIKASHVFSRPQPNLGGMEIEELKDVARQALLATKIIAYAQGFALYKAAGAAYGWDLEYDVIAQIFRAGCIIRSSLLNPMMEAFKNNKDLENLMLDPYFTGLLEENIQGLRDFVTLAVQNAIPVPAMAAALSYFDTYICENGSANMIQAQRDYFGSHTYRRVDIEGSFHHEWE